MAEEAKTSGSERPLKTGKGRIQVSLLDDTVVAFQIEPKSKGEVLYHKVNGHLKVDESDYFGLQYYDAEGNMCWLDPLKAINKQVKEALKVTFKFRVMFYTPEPNSLQEYTRYLFTLQVRRDLLDGRLHCSEETGALLASYIVQGELGDFDETIHHDGYLSGFQFVPYQSPEIEEKIIEYHMTHRGKSPAEADRCMLDVARQLEMYGITLYPAKDRDDADLSLSVFHMGILVFQNQKRINMFSWAKIRKLSFKKKKFLIKLHPKVYSADLVEFVMQSRNACKGFWKICIAHHVFFRQKQAVPKTSKPSLLTRGSKFRYSGRTQKQLMDDCRDTFKPTANDLDRNRTSRIQRGNDSMTVSSDNELTMVPTTPPPSYSSFKFDAQFERNHSIPSVSKCSTDASEDEGSFTVGSAKSPPLHFKNETTGVDTDVILQTESLKIIQKDEEKSLANGEDLTGQKEMAGEERSESDLEIQREVHSIMDQIEKETSWQYHLTTTELDDSSLHGNNNSDFDAALQNEFEVKNFCPVVDPSYPLDMDHKEEMKESLLHKVEANGDLNSNDVVCTIEKKDVEISQNEPEGVDNFERWKNGSISESLSSASLNSNIEIEEDDLDDDIGRCLSQDALNENNIENCIKPKSSSYDMAKDVLLTERTYIKDLEILTVSFRELVLTQNAMSESLMDLYFGNIDPLYDFHCSFLAELEERIAYWEETMNNDEDPSLHKISDIMLSNVKNLKLYVGHINTHGKILMEFQDELSKSEKLKKACKEFELSKLCYLSINTFLLKPTRRWLYYKFILSRMHNDLTVEDVNYSETKAAYEEILDIYKSVTGVVETLENLHKLVELNRDLMGTDRLIHPKREFIREGCLYKVCQKGLQPRMFFLFSDCLLYSAEAAPTANRFRIKSQIPLKTMKVKADGDEMHGLYQFVIEDHGQSVVVGATSKEDQLNWIQDLTAAISKLADKCHGTYDDVNFYGSTQMSIVNNCSNAQLPPPILISMPVGEDDDDDYGDYFSKEGTSTLDRNHAHVRTLSTRRVCWHRNTSISMNEYKLSAQNNISGYLYRKCKNQSKWQRLWVVFTNFSLFFFTSYEDDEPLASLPLIGYKLSSPTDVQFSNEEFCFVLHFKAHVYTFKAESQYFFSRWVDALQSVTRNSYRTDVSSTGK